MSLADKFEYLIGTKTAIRDALNESGARIDESLPFRQYAGWVDWLNYSRENVLRNLYSSGETGTLASDLPYFTNTAGTTEATWGDPVGLVKDASPNRADLTQGTVTARPVLARVPRGGRRNEAVVSEGINWTANSSAVVTYDGESPYGVTPSARVVTAENQRSSGVYRQNLLGRVLPAGTEITVSIRLKPILMTSPLRVAFEGSAFPNTPVANIDLDSRTVNPVNSFASWRLGEGEDGFFVAEATMTPSADGTINISIYNQNENTGSNEFLITALQVEFSETASPYQSVLSTYNITEAGVEDIHYLSFDLTDDNLTTTIPAIENGTVVIAGTNGIWIDEDYNFDGGTFSIGPTTYTDGPDGILTAIGEPIERGFLVINRQLSQLERDLVIQEMKERGAPGVFELGPELYPEGRFEDGIDNIGEVSRGTAEWSDGALKLVTTEVAQTQYGVVATTLNLSSLQSDVPRFVEVAYTSEVANTNQVIRVNRSAAPNAQIIQSGSFAAGSGRSYMYIPAGGNIHYLNLRSERGSATVGDTFLVQLISIRKLELIT